VTAPELFTPRPKRLRRLLPHRARSAVWDTARHKWVCRWCHRIVAFPVGTCLSGQPAFIIHAREPR
jgi:hypothetical protein